ncbi:hypothetical protein SCOR_19180 [Sulfidibacter corallicola]
MCTNTGPFLLSDVHGFLLNFFDERPMALLQKPGVLFLSRNRVGLPAGSRLLGDRRCKVQTALGLSDDILVKKRKRQRISQNNV